jgi:hypothetical protein
VSNTWALLFLLLLVLMLAQQASLRIDSTTTGRRVNRGANYRLQRT